MKAPQMSDVVINMQSSLKQNADIRAGKDAIFLNREDYITRLDDQSDEQFESMVKMAPVYVLYPKVVDGFTGTVFSKSPNIKGIDDKGIKLLENVDMLGNSLDKLSEKIVGAVIENGFCATTNDYSNSEKTPFIRYIDPSQFVSFRTSSEKGYPIISQFIYREEVDVDDPDDEFAFITINQYIVLDLFEGDFRVRTFQQKEKKQDIGIKEEEVELISENFPMMGGKKFDYIPIQIHGVESNNFTIKKSPLQDISDMNISIIQRVVDQVYMLHWTALPTPWITGVDEGDAPATIGPTKIWHISNELAKVGMLEFSGQSAKHHQEFIDNLKDIMAATGAQILKKEGVSRETATSVLVRTAAQTSLVSTLVKNVSEQIERTLKVYYDWNSIITTEDFKYKLNDDFIKIDMEPNAQIALVKSWLDGAISHETVFNKMKEGELIDPNRTFEDELKAIEDNPPPFFDKEVDAENAENLADKTAEYQSKEADKVRADKQVIGGSNLEGAKVPNKTATEQV